jgi:hypothetical protein
MLTHNQQSAMAPSSQQPVAVHWIFVPKGVSRAHSHFQIKSLDNDVLTLAMLCHHINPLKPPLYCLTPDVFSEVASHLQSEADLIKLTHVSYCLHTMLLSHPSSWVYVDLKASEKGAFTYFTHHSYSSLFLAPPTI